MVRAECREDIVATVNFARKYGKKLCVRAGGHSYAGSFLQNDSILLDISALNDIEINRKTGIARIGPGVTGRQLMSQLEPLGLAFPTGHGGNVALSGFLLGGGLGINAGAWGQMSVFNVVAVDVVTADGRRLHANATENAELWWAARGAGPNAFFVVSDFYLQCWPHPETMTSHLYQVPQAALPLLFEMLDSYDWDRRLQIMVILNGDNHEQAFVNTLAFADSRRQADELQALFTQRIQGFHVDIHCLAAELMPDFESIYQQNEQALVCSRFRTDNLFTDRILDVYAVLREQLPSQPAPKGMSMIVWRGHQHLPDAAYSATGRYFISTYLQWDDADDDERNRQWLKQCYDQLTPYASGHYINEFDLEGRAASIGSCYREANWLRFEALREEYDPTALFPRLNLE
ncbi:FAD-binding oxidoreductase [Serratia rubidaea]|uniref:FAD-binding oxidoreductase n=1 Tax=Serratia rubidaea TaxID=61652 RepID=UPI0022B929C8|nr:FAD-binding protein [Serratia rubidaea]WBF47729.1 FAD-binding protein [Serratia rubidaea]